MLAPQIAEAAEEFLSKLHAIDSRLLPLKTTVDRPDAGRFCDIFREAHEPEAGAYWFFTPEGTIFDIGKSEDSVWARICAHAGKPIWLGDPAADHQNTIGDGWGFTASSHLRYNIDKTSEETRRSIETGTFHVGWVIVDPPYLAPLLEVYLQTIYLAATGELPELCYRIG